MMTRKNENERIEKGKILERKGKQDSSKPSKRKNKRTRKEQEFLNRTSTTEWGQETLPLGQIRKPTGARLRKA